MKILLVFEYLSPIGGGSQKAVLDWFKQLKKSGVKTKLLCSQPTDKNLLKQFDKDDLIVNDSLKLNFIYPDFSIPIPQKNTIKLIEEFKPDIIHFHESFLFALRLKRIIKKLKIKTIASLHTNFESARLKQFPLSLLFNKQTPFPKLLHKFQLYHLSQADYVTAPSRYYQKHLSQRLNKKVFLLPYPIPEHFFSRKLKYPKIPTKLITVSRLSGEKKIDFLLEVLRLLKGKYTLTIVGDGPDKVYFQKKSKKLRLDFTVEFKGWIQNKNLPKIFQQHHLFISASDVETFGIVYIEALASGLPCAVFDYPVTREAIPTQTSIFVKNYDPRKWAKKLLSLQKKPPMYIKLLENIKANYPKLLKYQETNSTKRLLQIYREILDSRL